jgi:hypothetical protein
MAITAEVLVGNGAIRIQIRGSAVQTAGPFV